MGRAILLPLRQSQDIRRAARIAGIDDAAHGAVAGHERVRLINEQRRAARMDRAKQRTDGDIGGNQGLAGHGGQDTQQSGFAATLFR